MCPHYKMLKTDQSFSLGCRGIDQKISNIICRFMNWPIEYPNVFEGLGNDRTNIKIYSVWGKATNTNTIIFVGNFVQIFE